MSRHGLNFARHGLPALAILGALLFGALCGKPPAGRSRVSDDAPPMHFLSGSERSLPVLQEISATMKRIDERLARLEKIAMQAAEKDRKE